MPLGDLFPKELREQLSNDNLKVGSVLRYYKTNTIPPKLKRAVVVGFDNDKILFASVFINSEVNPNMFPTQRLRDLHLSFEAINRDYIDHDSFVDCSQIHVENVQTVKTLMIDDESVHIGDLSDADCEKVIETLKMAHTIPRAVKRRYGLM